MAKSKLTHLMRSRAVQTSRALFDEDMTAAAIHVADSQITTEDQAGALFAFATASRALNKAPSVDDLQPTFSTYDWELGQKLSRSWLPKIARLDTLPRSSRAALTAELRRTLQAFGTIDIDVRDGDLQLYVQDDTVAFATVRGLLPFFLRYGFPPSRIFQCQHSDCGKWFLRKVKPGPQEMYCSRQHQNLAKQWRYRGKDS